MKTLKLDQPLETIDGVVAELLKSGVKHSGENSHGIIVLLHHPDGTNSISRNTIDGKNIYSITSYDLINVPKVTYEYQNIYIDGSYSSRYTSSFVANKKIFCVLEFKLEDGQIVDIQVKDKQIKIMFNPDKPYKDQDGN